MLLENVYTQVKSSVDENHKKSFYQILCLGMAKHVDELTMLAAEYYVLMECVKDLQGTGTTFEEFSEALKMIGGHKNCSYEDHMKRIVNIIFQKKYEKEKTGTTFEEFSEAVKMIDELENCSYKDHMKLMIKTLFQEKDVEEKGKTIQ